MVCCDNSISAKVIMAYYLWSDYFLILREGFDRVTVKGIQDSGMVASDVAGYSPDTPSRVVFYYIGYLPLKFSDNASYFFTTLSIHPNGMQNGLITCSGVYV